MPDPASEDSLAWLLAPLAPEEFERDFYEQRPCLVKRRDSDYYERLLTPLDLDTVLCTHAASRPDIDLVRSDGDVPMARYVDGNNRINPLAVAKQFDEGATVIFNQLHRRIPALARLCASLGRVLGSRLQTNIYLTPPHGQGFAPHWDTHDVFVLQVSGSKRWFIYDEKVALPLTGQRFDPEHDTPGAVSDEFVLEPGCVTYIPRGWMHSARTTQEASLHITLGLTAFTWTDFFLESVAAAALEEDVLRRNLPIGFANQNGRAGERERLYREKLGLLMSRLDPARLWKHFEDQVNVANSPLFGDLLGSRCNGAPLGPDSDVRRRADVVVEPGTAGAETIVRFAGQGISVPGRVSPAAEFVATVREFKVRDLPDCLDAAAKVTLVDRLIKEGLLERVGIHDHTPRVAS